MSFYAEPDVQAVLSRAIEGGKVRMTWIINESVRAYGEKHGYARKIDKSS